MKTRKTRPTGPDDSIGRAERLAWLVIDIETGSVLGKITRVSTSEPGYTDHFQAYACEYVDYGEEPKPPIRLGPWEQCRNAQEEIERWHTQREDAERAQALAETRETGSRKGNP